MRLMLLAVLADAVAISVAAAIGEALARLEAWVETGDADNARAAGG